MRFDTLHDWLVWQETALDPRRIELGLERVGRVWAQLGRDPLPFRIITVAGTNGKGSCAAMLESALRAGGYRVGLYTSPHLLRYNERIRIDGTEVEDAALCRAFNRVDEVRGETPLTYFEFGTLAALDLFLEGGLDVVVLEVGLGGRLDAVNVVAADVALVASVGIDHVDWLGDDREQIGREKAGIFRPGRPAVCGDPAPPATLIAHARALGVPLYRIGKDFSYTRHGESWTWRGWARQRDALPLPALRGPVQLRNAAAVLAVLELLGNDFPLSQDEIRRGLQGVALPGRFQVVPGDIPRILDVTHNPDGARELARNLRAFASGGRTLAVVAMRSDKDTRAVARILDPLVGGWYPAGLSAPDTLSAERLARRLVEAGVGAAVTPCASVAGACTAAEAAARPGDRILVFGSFLTVAEALRRCI